MTVNDRIVYEITRDGHVIETTYRALLRTAAREVCSPRGVETEYGVEPRTIYCVTTERGRLDYLHREDAEDAVEICAEDGIEATISERQMWEVVRWMPDGRRRRAQSAAECYATEAEAEDVLYACWERDLERSTDIEWYETREEAEAALAERDVA